MISRVEHLGEHSKTTYPWCPKTSPLGRGYKANPNGLSDREHVCLSCGLLTTRDHASAMDILRLGLSFQPLTVVQQGAVDREAPGFSRGGRSLGGLSNLTSGGARSPGTSTPRDLRRTVRYFPANALLTFQLRKDP